MRPVKTPFRYESVTILVAWVSASSGCCALILFFLFPLAGIDSGHPCQPVIGTDTFLLYAVWCTASYFFAACIALTFSNALKRVLPAWLLISILGSVIYPFTFWTFTYWDALKRYQPNSPFCAPPPPFWLVMRWATTASVICFLFAGMFSFVASLLPLRRKESSFLHLDD